MEEYFSVESIDQRFPKDQDELHTQTTLGALTDIPHCLSWSKANLFKQTNTEIRSSFLPAVTGSLLAWESWGRDIMAFCRQPGVHGSVQNGCCLNRLGELERRDANH